MNKSNFWLRPFCLILLLFGLLMVGCTEQEPEINIVLSNITIEVGETQTLQYRLSGLTGIPKWTSDNSNIVSVDDDGMIKGIMLGKARVVASISGVYDSIDITVTEVSVPTLLLSVAKNTLAVDSSMLLSVTKNNIVTNDVVTYQITSGSSYATIEDGYLIGKQAGTVTIVAKCGSVTSNAVSVTITSASAAIVEEIIIDTNKTSLKVGESCTLTALANPDEFTDDVIFVITSGTTLGELNQNVFTARVVGTVTIVGKIGNVVSDPVTITITSAVTDPTSIALTCSDTRLSVGESATLSYNTTPTNANQTITYFVTSGASLVNITGNTVEALAAGTVVVYGKIGNTSSNQITLTISEIITDPYENVDEEEFYENYTEATSYQDAYYRTLHYLMSGSIADQEQEPTLSVTQPQENGYYLRNSSAYYSSDYLTYYVVNSDGEVVNTVYKSGAYVTLEDVAAYIYAFGDVPTNYVASNSMSPTKSDWGKWLRLNHNVFSGDVSQYPYEPYLPNISGNGGSLIYYEVDVGTTGTDCDPNYSAVLYNTGTKITRGAARIVYSRYYLNGDEIDDLADRYVFYTYNHYNDFQEYLNYEGGWGSIFGNITGGGTISSRTNYNPTAYIEVIRKPFLNPTNEINQLMLPFLFTKRRFAWN